MTNPIADPLEVMSAYVGHARWFGGKGRPFTLAGRRRLGEVPGGEALGGEHGGPRVAIDLLTIEYSDSAGGTEYYQLPLAFYAEPQEHLTHALVGMWEDEDFGPSHVYDAVHDRYAMAHWLSSFAEPDDEGPLRFHRLPGHELDLEAHSTLFSGEQSNSSVRFGEDSLLKVFRKITPGNNPDISVHEVLTRAGSEHVAALYGWLEVEDGDEVLQLAMLQQFLRTASDGWDLALTSVRNLFAEADLHADEVGGDFAGESARLGVALAETHASLQEHFPTQQWSTEQVTSLVDGMHRRLDDALDVVPALAEHADRLRATFDHVRRIRDLKVQQIHADLHLGQTLRTVKGWKIVDFEGEPAKPLSERLLPDSRWRDVAGMLRSFDYAPRVVERTVKESEYVGAEQREFRAAEWAERNRDAFLSAYAGGDLTVDQETLLSAYVADKAVYEVVYEARNRPGWVDIPLAAIRRIEKS
ncbi:MAG: maltokinase N-terminal cap-like domain-containing protein [Nocardioides sp.]